MSTTITSLPAANSIDGSLDVFPIVTNSLNTTQKISRNTFLNLTSQPLGLTDTQSPTNKTFDNTNTLTIKDANLTIQNSSSTTKQAKFSAASITAGQTRTFTLPDVSDTVVTLTATQTLTNKTLTSPTISSPTITNAAISADTITGFSSSSTGTLYGIAVTSSQLSGTAISNTTIPYTALDTGSSWAYSTFSPAAAGFTGAVTTNVARYKQIGKTTIMDVDFSGTSNATTCTFTLPTTPKSTAYYHLTVQDSGTTQTSSGLLKLSASSTTATCYKTLAQGAFTNSGTKQIQGFGIVYEVA